MLRAPNMTPHARRKSRHNRAAMRQLPSSSGPRQRTRPPKQRRGQNLVPGRRKHQQPWQNPHSVRRARQPSPAPCGCGQRRRRRRTGASPPENAQAKGLANVLASSCGAANMPFLERGVHPVSGSHRPFSGGSPCILHTHPPKEQATSEQLAANLSGKADRKTPPFLHGHCWRVQIPRQFSRACRTAAAHLSTESSPHVRTRRHRPAAHAAVRPAP